LGKRIENFGADWILPPQASVDDLTAPIKAWCDAGGTESGLIAKSCRPVARRHATRRPRLVSIASEQQEV
jgi:hypothetical protein